MRRLAVLALVVGCSGDDAVELDAREVDARPADAEPSDGRPPIDAEAAACIPGAAPMHQPESGTYCATWTRIDGITDAFARYYDRADVTATGVRWWTSGSGGTKERDATASIDAGCLLVSGFSGSGGQATSDPIRLCWSDAARACGSMTWYQPPPGADGHWSVQLDACP
jgi:hypothetical protein